MKHLLLLAFLIFQNYLSAQRTYIIQPLDAMPVIDGVAADSAWLNVPETGDFTTTFPRFGQTPQQATSVKMGYANGYIFIMARCQSQSVRADGSERDDAGQADYFSVGLDTWNDDQNNYQFTVTPSGQQIDANEGSQLYFAPWKSAGKTGPDGWIAEIAIPFAVLTFAEGQMNWGLQFSRYDRTTGETTVWNPQNPLIIDEALQFGNLQGPVLSKKIRYSMLSLYGNSHLNRSDPVSSDIPTAARIDAGGRVDAHVVVNSSTALDISMIPYRNRMIYNYGLSGYLFRYYEFEAAVNHLQIYNATGYNLFAKSNAYLSTLEIEPSWYSTEKVDLEAGEVLRGAEGGRQLMNFKLTHRTRNNWRVGTHTVLFSDVRAIVYNNMTGEGRKPGVHALPFYNHTTVEKIFRNNSWFNVSLSNVVLGQNLNKNLLTSAGQWRDRSNRFEISGNWFLNLNNASVKRLINLPDGNFALRKINGTWNYGLIYYTNGFSYRGSVEDLYYTNPKKHVNFLTGYLTKRNFQPRQLWLNNIEQSVEAFYSTKLNPINNKNYNSYRYILKVQDRKFRTYEIIAGSSVGKTTERITYSDGVSLEKSVLSPSQLHAKFETDPRKKWQINPAASLYFTPLSQRFVVLAAISSRLKLNNKWNVEHTIYLNYNHKTYKAVVLDGSRRGVHFFNTAGLYNQLNMNYIPNNYNSFQFGFWARSDENISNHQFYFVNSGDFVPADEFYSYTTQNRYGVFTRYNHFGKSGTRHQLHIRITKTDQKAHTQVPQEEFDNLQLYIGMSFIHNFVKHN